MGKVGVGGFVKSLAVRVGPEKIRVNAVCPGPIDTPMLRVFVARPDQKSTAGMDPEDLVRKRAHGSVPLGRTGRPEEIANAALFLLSDEASFITGAALPVDGGVTAARAGGGCARSRRWPCSSRVGRAGRSFAR